MRGLKLAATGVATLEVSEGLGVSGTRRAPPLKRLPPGVTDHPENTPTPSTARGRDAGEALTGRPSSSVADERNPRSSDERLGEGDGFTSGEAAPRSKLLRDRDPSGARTCNPSDMMDWFLVPFDGFDLPARIRLQVPARLQQLWLSRIVMYIRERVSSHI